MPRGRLFPRKSRRDTSSRAPRMTHFGGAFTKHVAGAPPRATLGSRGSLDVRGWHRASQWRTRHGTRSGRRVAPPAHRRAKPRPRPRAAGGAGCARRIVRLFTRLPLQRGALRDDDEVRDRLRTQCGRRATRGARAPLPPLIVVEGRNLSGAPGRPRPRTRGRATRRGRPESARCARVSRRSVR